jgi:hypothetical protein
MIVARGTAKVNGMAAMQHRQAFAGFGPGQRELAGAGRDHHGDTQP